LFTLKVVVQYELWKAFNDEDIKLMFDVYSWQAKLISEFCITF
jgi:hypothetical protein